MTNIDYLDPHSLALHNLVGLLDAAKKLAVEASLDHHFVSEIDHLIATAEANKEAK